MNFYEMILSRRTIRRFHPKPIPPQELEWLVDAARLAPSAANRQPCEFILVDEDEKKERLFPLLKWAAYIDPLGTPKEAERPAAYIVVLVNRQKTPDVGAHDAAAAVMNIIYAGMAFNLGACWMGAIDRAGIKQLFGIPEHCDVDSVVALGYPAESPVAEPMKDSVKYWKDFSDVLHVPKRSLADVLHRNRY